MKRLNKLRVWLEAYSNGRSYTEDHDMKRLNKLRVWLEAYSNGRSYWHWHLRSPYNGRIICAGEPNGYCSKAKAIAGWKIVVKSAGGTGMGNVEIVE